jgi:hypothetical protein
MDTNPNPTTKVKSDITEFSIPITLEKYNKYYWKVVAKDDKGAKTESPIYSFTYDKEWQKTYGGSDDDEGYSIQKTNDGGYIIAGYTESKNGDVSYNHGDSDVWIIKLDKHMNLEWQKTYGGSSRDVANSIQQTSDGGYIVAGNTASTNGDVTKNHGGSDVWIIKLNKDGDLEWERTFGGSGYEHANSIQQTSDGGYIVVGATGSTDGDVKNKNGKYWVIKLDKNGNLEWEKTFGGSDSYDAYSIKQTIDSGYIFIGNTHFGFITDSGKHEIGDINIIKLDKNGNLEWERTFGGLELDWAYSIQQTIDGGYIVAGNTWSTDGDVSYNHGGSDIWIIKLDKNGNLEWERTFGGLELDWAYSIQQTIDGGYIVAGNTWSTDGDVSYNHGGSDIWIIKLDKNGNLEWERTFGGLELDWAYSIQQTIDGGYIVAGETSSTDGDVLYNHGDSDVWVIKLDDNSMNSMKDEIELEKENNSKSNTAPIIKITYPSNNSTNLELNPTITWEALDNENDKIRYNIYLNDELISENYSARLRKLKLNPNTKYILKIVAFDEHNTSNESSITFTTTKVPTISFIEKPENNSIIYGGDFNISLIATDSDNDKLTFDVYMDTNPNLDITTKIKSDITESSIRIPLKENGVYYWKVVAKDDKGAKIESPVYSFKYELIQWEKKIKGYDEDHAELMQQTIDGGYVIVGYTSSTGGDVSSNNGGSDILVIKLDKNGNLEWWKTYGGLEWDVAYSIQQTSDGGFIVAGTGSIYGDIAYNHGGSDVWIIKLDKNGNLEWEKTYGGSEDDEAKSIQQTQDGGYIVAGYTESTDGDVTNNHGGSDVWIIKLDKEGSIEWEKTFGGSYDDYAESIQITTNGGYIVTGKTNSTDGDVSYNRGDSDIWIIKLDKNGNLEWEKTYGGSEIDEAKSIHQTIDSGYIVFGETWSEDGDVSDNDRGSGAWIIKLDKNGNIEWQKIFDGILTVGQIIQTTDNGYIAVGGTYEFSDVLSSNNYGYIINSTGYWIIKLDENGNIEWQKIFDGGTGWDHAKSILQTKDGYVVVGDYYNYREFADIWIIKFYGN